jgi:excisionase family DNA binding protein
MIKCMKGFFSVDEAAARLDVSPRRVRAMIAEEKLPAEKLGGRWVLAAETLDGFNSHPAGRPMSEKSVWCVLRYLSGVQSLTTLPSRLRTRVRELLDKENAEQILRGWAARRASSMHMWASAEELKSLLDDARVVISGGLCSEEPACVYIDTAEGVNIVREYGLRPRPEHPITLGVTLQCVENLDAVPRSITDGRCVAVPVAALDLRDFGQSRSIQVADQILASAIGHAVHREAPSAQTISEKSYGDRRPYVVVDDLHSLRAPTKGVVTLPISLDWGPDPTYNMADAQDRQTMYERVLSEALHVEQLQTFLNEELLVELWSQMWLSPRIRTAWEEHFPQLARK